MKVLFLFLSLSLCLFNVNAAYQRGISRQLAFYSIVAYESPNNINAWNCGNCGAYGISQPKAFLDATQTVQGYTGYASNLNAVIVCFRGSNNIANWIADLSTAPIPYTYCGGCMVHSGFLASYGLVVSYVRNTVNNLLAKYRGARLIITGHSLGGAIAILAGADLSMYHTVSAIYTFGQPRVGNPAFSNWFESRLPNTFRVVHYADIVPHVPPSALGYQHSALQAWYTSNMQAYKLCGRQASDCANSLGSYNIGDHDMYNYIKLPSLAQQQKSLLTKAQQFFSNFGVKVGLRQQNSDQWKIIEEVQTTKFFYKIKQTNKASIEKQ